MKILITGSGATGGYIGARLIEKGEDVTFFTGTSRKVRLLTRGLELTSPYGRFRRPASAISAGEVSASFDLVILAARAHEFESLFDAISPAIGAQTIVLPLVDGVRHLDIQPLEPGVKVIGAVYEARVSIDADGILHQRPPAGEIRIGALNCADHDVVTGLVGLFQMRGIKAFAISTIKAATWGRFSYLAAGIATSIVMKCPLRDAFRFPHGTTTFEGALAECLAIGRAAGFEPDPRRLKDYANAFLLEGRPVKSPPSVLDGGREADEAIFLLAEMVAIGRQWSVPAYRLNGALDTLTRHDLVLAAVAKPDAGA